MVAGHSRKEKKEGEKKVAVRAIIADRPRTDPYERRYRIRLLPRMSGVKT